MNNDDFPTLSPFIAPDVFAELGEFQRVGELFGIDSATLMYVAQTEGELVLLRNSVWEQLGNTDSHNIDAGDWDTVAHHSDAVKRNYIDLRNKIQVGHQIDAPIILKYRSEYHLVSGNTRLMVSRALGIMPVVLLFEVFDNETGL